MQQGAESMPVQAYLSEFLKALSEFLSKKKTHLLASFVITLTSFRKIGTLLFASEMPVSVLLRDRAMKFGKTREEKGENRYLSSMPFRAISDEVLKTKCAVRQTADDRGWGLNLQYWLRPPCPPWRGGTTERW
jgi:hypothetical protein